MKKGRDIEGMKANLKTLNMMLFAQLDQLANGNLNKEELELEIAKTKEINQTADRILDVGRLALDVQKFMYEVGEDVKEVPKMLGV